MATLLIPSERKREFFDLVLAWHKLDVGEGPLVAAVPTEGPTSTEWAAMYGVPESLIAFLKERSFQFELA